MKKTERLLTENFALKTKSQERQSLVDGLLNAQGNPNPMEIRSLQKTLEMRSDIIAQADRHH